MTEYELSASLEEHEDDVSPGHCSRSSRLGISTTDEV